MIHQKSTVRAVAPAPHSARTTGRLISTFAFFVIVVSFIDTMAQLPVLPTFVRSLGASATMLGVVLASYSLANMAGNLGAGLIVDRFGRRAGIVLGMAVAGTAVALYSLVTTPGQLVGLRVLHGLGGSVLVPAAFAYAGDAAHSDRAGRAMGHSGAAVALAALIGPVAGGVFRATYGARPLFVTIAVLLAVTAVLVVSFLPESYREPKSSNEEQLRFSQRILPVLTNRPLRFIYAAVFFVQAAMGALSYSLPLAVEAAGFSAARTGLLFSVFSLVAIAFFLLPTAGLSDRFGRPVIVRIGMVLLAAALGFVPFASGLGGLSVAMIIYGAGYGLCFPALCASVVDQTDKPNRGTGFGVFYAVFSAGVAAGPIASGFAAEAGLHPLGLIAVTLVVAQVILPAATDRQSPAA